MASSLRASQEPRSGLAVDASLTLAHGRDRLRVDGSGESLAVTIPSLAACFRLARVLPGRGARRQAAKRLDRFLRQMQLSAAIKIGRFRIAELGTGARQSWTARVLGLGP